MAEDDPKPEGEPTPTDEELQTKFNGMVEKALDAYKEKNAPAPPKTSQPRSFLDQLFGS
jgi:hypothetical protein